METKFNFNSQICTSKVQSERLLALGLKPETADMHYSTDHRGNVRQLWLLAYGDLHEDVQVHSLPAWSLHRLLSMLPDDAPKIYWILDGANISMEWENDDSDFFPHRGNMYNGIISCIEWLIKEGYFNKEYLEE